MKAIKTQLALQTGMAMDLLEYQLRKGVQADPQVAAPEAEPKPTLKVSRKQVEQLLGSLTRAQKRQADKQARRRQPQRQETAELRDAREGVAALLQRIAKAMRHADPALRSQLEQLGNLTAQRGVALATKHPEERHLVAALLALQSDSARKLHALLHPEPTAAEPGGTR